MIRVCHMTSVHPWDDVRIFHKECRSLAAAGHDVHLVACAGQDRQLDGVAVHAVRRSEGGRLRRMLGTAWRVYRTARGINADVYHFHDPELIPYGLLLRLHGKKVIYDAHEDVPRDILSKPWIAPWLRRMIGTAFEVFEDGAARIFSAVVAATPHIAHRFLRLNSRSVAINNYPMQSELVGDITPGSRGRVVCYVGGISRMRGAVEMIRAIASVDAKLILAGKFENPALEHELRGLPGWKNVDYRGLVGRDEVRRIYAESSAGLLFFHPEPNHVDAQPNKMFEYMSAGLPVLASDFPLWRKVLEEVDAGRCVDPLDHRAIAALVNEILDNPERSAAMGAAGRAAVLSSYRWENEERKLADLYNSLS